MLRLVLLFCAVFTSAHSFSTAVTQCTGHPGDLPINAYIHGCETPPCILPQLEDCVVDIVFRAPTAIQSMSTLAVAYMSIGPITIPLPYNLQEQAITCNYLTNTYCPLIADEVVVYTLKMFIEPFFPVGTSVIIEFRIVDQADAPIMCIRLPVSITAPNNSRKSIIIGEAKELNNSTRHF